MSRLIALGDANNFFVSCERIFRPDLQNKPVVVLSNNDGCVISRSAEAKRLNIPMGAPYFKWKPLFDRHGVAVFSGNMRLYQDISTRVAHTLLRFTDVLEQYSIDESFFNLSIRSLDDPEGYCRKIRSEALREVGIPLSIGISTTKTLCKLASETAKKRNQDNSDTSCVCMLLPMDAARLFDKLPVDEIWGIGRHMGKKLRYMGVGTVAQLLSRDDEWVKKHLTIRGLQTVHELRGIPCFPLEEAEAKQKSMMVSSSFGQRLTELDDIKTAVMKHASEGAFRLRRAGLRAGLVGCELRTSYFIESVYKNCATEKLSPPTSQTDEIVATALRCLEKIYRPGIQYAKTGIYLDDLRDTENDQLQIDDLDPVRAKMDRLMAALDTINLRCGLKTVIPAAISDTSKSDPQKKFLSKWE